MKSSKLIEIFESGNVVIPIYFLKQYKKLNLSMEEFVFLMYLNSLGNKFVFDPSKFSNDLNLDMMDVMNYISVLSDKSFISVDVLKNEKGIMEEVVILDSFYNKLSLLTIEDVNDKKNDISNSNIFEIIEKEFGRTLSPIEYEIIKAWLDNDIGEDLIKEAIKEATFNGVSNLRYIDKILYEWGKKGIKTVEDVEVNRKSRVSKKNDEVSDDIDLDMVDWDWFDEE